MKAKTEKNRCDLCYKAFHLRDVDSFNVSSRCSVCWGPGNVPLPITKGYRVFVVCTRCLEQIPGMTHDEEGPCGFFNMCSECALVTVTSDEAIPKTKTQKVMVKIAAKLMRSLAFCAKMYIKFRKK